jgi:CarboxypepD_reg-like domain
MKNIIRYLVLIFCSSFFYAVSYTQIVITGKVLNDETNLAIPNASVYLNNTSIGTFTNNMGEFTLIASSIYAGELIVSSIGYQPLFYQLDNVGADKKRYTFKLILKENILKSVLVISNESRKQWLQIFKDNFLGITEEADNCTIENIEAVYFTAGADKNTIYAYADTPLIIINKMLGYKIAFDLVEFNFDKTELRTYFLGYNRYEEMGEKKKWLKRRKENYYGSVMHFYRSLINKELDKEGFSIFEIKIDTGSKKSVLNTNREVQKVAPSIIIEPLQEFQVLYIDSITNEYALQFSNKIMVQYNRQPHSYNYLSNKIIVAGITHFGFVAYINLLVDKVGLDINGIVHLPLQVVYEGFWMYEKLANQLPFNYYVDN